MRLLLLATAATLAAQTPAWEVASIKPSRDTAAESNLDSAPGGRLTATNITVRELMRLAYNVKDYQIVQAPAWLGSERFDIAARGTARKSSTLDEERSHVRELLEDRFGLKTRRETKQLPVYLLVVAKGGAKLRANTAPSGSGTRKSCGHLAGTLITADVLATVLSRHFERDVLNRTGLQGKYDFQLDWTPDSGPCPTADGAAPVRPSIFTAIQEQLGLKLEASKGPVETLVVDRVERPSAN